MNNNELLIVLNSIILGALLILIYLLISLIEPKQPSMDNHEPTIYYKQLEESEVA